MMTLDSVHVLGKAKIDLWSKITLSYGKNFIPTPNRSTVETLREHFDTFARRTRLKYQFQNQEERRLDPLYEPNRTFQPKEASAAIEEYLDNVWLNMQASIESNKRSPLTSRHTKAAHRHVTKLRQKLIASKLHVATADKNLGLVVIPISDYETNMQDTLNSEAFTQVSRDTVIQNTRAVYHHIVTAARIHLRGENKKPDNIFKFVTAATPANSKTPEPYLLYKVHKLTRQELLNQKIPPTRLIVPNTFSITRRISRYLDSITRPILQRRVDYLLWDSKSLVQELETRAFKCPCVLQTMDVKALYPSIPIRLGCRLMRQFLTNEMPPIQLDFICSMFELVMNNAFVQYKQKYYHQKVGTSMGTSCAVIFANVFLHMLERGIMSDALQARKILTFKRLIDDIFIVTPCVTDGLQFAERYNNLHENIEITHDVGEQVEFLDLRIRRQNHTGYKRLKVSLHQKLHNRYAYLPWSSYHPRGAKCGYIKAELMRAIRNSSNATEFQRYVPIFARRLRGRGYPLKVIQRAFDTAHYFKRRQYLFGQSRRQASTQSSRVIFTVPFNPLTKSMDIPKLLREGWQKVLEDTSYDTEWMKPPMVAYKKCATLATLLKRDRESVETQPTTDGST